MIDNLHRETQPSFDHRLSIIDHRFPARATVMGLGRFGGGLGAALYLLRQGSRVTVTDLQTRDQLRESVHALTGLADDRLTLRLGEHQERDFTDTDLLVVSPAVKPVGNRYLDAARAAGVPCVTEIQLLTRQLNRQRTLGVTGSAGKSTTTAMIGQLLLAAGERVHVGGNLGGSLLHELPTIDPQRDWVVLELSSFMLHWLDHDRFSPHIAVMTNLAPNHLDWHGSFEAYAAAKQVIFNHQQPGDHAIRAPVDHRLPLLLPGEHNRINAGLALAAVRAVGVEPPVDALANFRGLPHRLQFVAEHQGVRYFNDSKATTPEATRLAIDAFPPGTVRVILGGSDKGANLTDLARHAHERCAGVYTIGDTGDAIAHACPGAHRCGTLEVAMERIATHRRRGEVVLLSTGCASFGLFTNYEHRGNRFVELVLAVTGEGSPNPTD